ncbi:MAG: glutamine--tRNA ligase/YqeY domain fusion protein [Gammaproteobacteria bacterium]|jgi:glutaminyl-tRNA synthetase|nr:glutamine--tRNA ligase/YqeY domain fusion protein [Gammaproteobacteria bacterium]MBT5202239.1 glutamine--tRNA ligase/YqeY domain fusion protein [Gammaproteobacteria bacterium]MBT5601686.1 glutamine--tRNA ligase/YqeY domain fusion protein [Gammaproteobacteria bacterium]MBT6245251.1 glutamine--tRNA ligase/YqeY domain fusion protein [Gammaproteobacteria bacterium]
MSDDSERYPSNFISNIIEGDLKVGKNGGRVSTRFPPEPNGFLHIGHAKAICLNFGLARDYVGTTNLRFDDTNPLKENADFMRTMREDIQWLGFQWSEERKASDYFEQLFEFAVDLIRQDKAYVDSLSAEDIRLYRGTLTQAGKNSPFRDRSIEENLKMFEDMRAGAFADGAHVLRLKIDMSSPNINMRDPAIYRIRHVEHHQTGNKWCIYPLYDYTHCISDALEGITHSLCDIGFEDHRPLYNWVLDQLQLPIHPQQIEFSRLNLKYTVMSKRKMKILVEQDLVEGWDDPRLPTLAGLRRRGYAPAAIRDFCRRIGVAKSENNVELALLESCLRENLEVNAPRAMAVLDPLKVIITNFSEDQVETLKVANHPKNEAMGERSVPFTRELYIDREDFRLEANRKYKRLVLGGEVRLRGGYVIRADDVKVDSMGKISELHCSYDPETLGVNPPDRKVRGVIHWVSSINAAGVIFRRFQPLFSVEYPDASDAEYTDLINPDSMLEFSGFLENWLLETQPGNQYQFERVGYFTRDSEQQADNVPVFNEVVGLRDSWAKING